MATPTPAPQGSKFDIPAEFQNVLQFVPCPDQRTDAQIVESLKDKGIDQLPSWQMHNVCDWIRLHGSDWTVRILDIVPGSVTNASHYLTTGDLQGATLKIANIDATIDVHAPQHAAEFLRTATMYTHGGAWLDVGIALYRSLDDICWNKIVDPNDPAELAAIHVGDTAIANGFVATKRENTWIFKWHVLWEHLWENKTSTKDMHKHPLLAPIISSAEDMARLVGEGLETVPHVFDVNDPGELYDDAANIVCWQRVAALIDPFDGFNGPAYWNQHILLLSNKTYAFGLEGCAGTSNAEDVLKILTIRLDAPATSAEYQAAYKAIWDQLAHQGMQAADHAKGLLQYPALGTVLDEHEGADDAPGTFAELLRYGRVNFKQLQPTLGYVSNPPLLRVLKRGLLEHGPITATLQINSGSLFS